VKNMKSESTPAELASLKTEPVITDNKTAPNPGSPITYEDCIAIIENASASGDVAATKAALSQLRGFFDKRIGKKKSDDEKDGGSSVKRAIESTRKFAKYEPKPVAQNEAQSLFS
jgi:hypothetical protein